MATQPTLTLLAGGGPLPSILAAAAQARGWQVQVIAFSGQPQPAQLTPTQTFAIGQVGHIVAFLKATHTTHVALAGHLTKPSLLNLKPDAMGLKLLAQAAIKHDDALLRVVTQFLQAQGFTLLSTAELAPELLAPAGSLAKAKLTVAEETDLALAISTLHQLGPLDLGQAVIVHNGAILGVECVEGTDALIQRCAALRGLAKSAKPAGLLVKRAKPNQTELADLPTIGLTTLQGLAEHHYRGVIVQAGKTLLLQQPQLVAFANAQQLVLQAHV